MKGFPLVIRSFSRSGELMISMRLKSDLAMKSHRERRLVNFTCNELYKCVADVNSYSEFVPWCKESRVTSSDENNLEADLVVGFGIVTEKYTSEVHLVENSSVIAIAKNTQLFDYLRTEWKFNPAVGNEKCWVDFQIDFKFKSQLYSNLTDMFFREVVSSMIQAFETRCKKLQKQRK